MYINHISKVPASWAETKSSNGVSASSYSNGYSSGDRNGHSNGHTDDQLPGYFLEDKAVRTVFGLVPLKYALDWPIFASYDELKGCAAWMGGRIPTFEEARSIYAHANALKKKKDPERQLGKTVPAVNG